MLSNKSTEARANGAIDERRGLRKVGVLAAALAAALAVAIVVAIASGSANIGLAEAARLLWAAVVGDQIDRADVSWYQIIWQVRTPRVLLAAVVGAGLGVAGVVMQATVRNVLADPYLLGVSAGASVGAVLVSITGFLAWAGIYAMSVGAFAGAIGAAALVYLASASRVNGLSPVRLVLTGVVLAAGFHAVMSVLVYLVPNNDSTSTVLFWTMGSFGAAAWGSLPVVAVAVLALIVVALRSARTLDIMSIGDESAAGLGVDADRTRRRMFVLVSIATGAMTATSGAIGFVGLVVPHAVRMIVGATHRRVLVIAPLVGAFLMVVVDTVARTLVAPRELPLSALTALLGVPVFVVLLRRRASVFGGA